MTLGFIMRLVYRGGPSSLGLYIIMYMLLLLSPCAFLAMDCTRLFPLSHDSLEAT